MGLGWHVCAYSSILFTKSKRQAHKAQKGLVPGMQGDGFATELGGIMKVALWPCGYVHNY